MKYWWVNQNQTYKFEVKGGFLWSPITNSNGTRNPFYDYMKEVSVGDIVFSFYGTRIQALGVVQKQATLAPKPNFESAGSYWLNEGWYVEVEFESIKNPFRPKEYIEILRDFLPEKYSPLQQNGNGNQKIYLTTIPENLAKKIIEIANIPIVDIQNELAPAPNSESDYEIELEVKTKFIDGDLDRIQLVKSRKGQGVFKSNVRLIEDHCRVTGVSNVRHLIASHIKPWRNSDNEEKLDGYNGLLLSPHVDHLFNYGFISFQNSGKLIISKELNPEVLDAWAISRTFDAGEFKYNHFKYLEFHRAEILK